MSGKNQGSTVAPCDCANRGQDEIYGKQMRLHNFCNQPITKKEMGGMRCTVCGKTKPRN